MPVRSRGRWIPSWSSVLLVVLVSASAAEADDAKDLAKLLSRPPSPGAMALLAGHLNQLGVADRVKLGLSSPDGKTRATAARLVNLGAIRELIPDVQKALDVETEAPAAEEQIGALVTIGGRNYDDAVLAARKRFSPRLDAELADVLARARGPEAIPTYFAVLREGELSEYALRRFFRMATRGQHDALNAASAIALGRHDDIAWRAVLEVAGESKVSIDEPMMIAALGSKQTQLRGETAWYAARHYSGAPPSNAAAILSALDDGERDAQPAGPELHFGGQILRRVLGQKPVEDEDWITCLETSLTCHLDSDFEESPLLDYLTDRERAAIQKRNHANRPEGAPKGKEVKSAGPKGVLLRLVSGLPVGVASDLFALEGCHSTSLTRWLSLASVDYRPDGLPRRVTVGTIPPDPPCQRIAQALFLLSTAPSEEADAAARPQSLLALFDPEAYACADRTAAAPAVPQDQTDAVRVRGPVVAPKLIKRIEPLYPKAARKNREEGVAIYEAVITSQGCVVDPRLLKSATPTLDVMGIEAISQWKYQPATLNNRPVRVYLTVTVTFRLNS
ncbi:MAG TPA: energy transducer TonB [Thermoanaerobaculia bacterium]